jgi:preprotein translocase subunit YajC
MKPFFLSILGLIALADIAVAENLPAVAETGMSGALTQGLMLGVFALIFYFLILRPQNKRAKEHRDLLTSLQKGDEVITSGGLVGKISKITDHFLVLAVAEGTEMVVQRNAIVTTLPKGTMKGI